jgi:cellulose synthase (UDP-forming)
MLAGAQATIDNLKLPDKQQPDGAPRWARTDQTIALWDYATADQLQGDGTAPLNVYFRIPPDIFYSERPNAVLKLVYRYNSIPIGPISSMQVRINNAFLGSVPLIPGQEASRKTETEVPVPVVNLRPFSNSLSFDFTFQLLKKGGCQDTTPINMQGAILRDVPGSARLSALRAAAQSGDLRQRRLPVHALADLSETTVVLPPCPPSRRSKPSSR